MKVLVVKTSSLGDVIHTLPAVTDAASAITDLQVDWVVEKAFQDIPAMHPAVNRVIPTQLRQWVRQPSKWLYHPEIREFFRQLRLQEYDIIIDAQGLIKSALIARFARGNMRCGLANKSAREGIASLFYQKKCHISWHYHAVTRVRKLFAQSLRYTLSGDQPDYGLCDNVLSPEQSQNPYIIFFHGTTWPTKHWPEKYWIELGALVAKAGYQVYLPWGNAVEQVRANNIASGNENMIVIPKSSIHKLAQIIANARAVVSVDSGLGHLSAALHKPTIALYGPTDPAMTGTYGPHQYHMSTHFPCAPCLQKRCTFRGEQTIFPQCFATLSPVSVWRKLQSIGVLSK